MLTPSPGPLDWVCNLSVLLDWFQGWRNYWAVKRYEITEEYGVFLNINMFYVPIEYKFTLQKDLKVLDIALNANGMSIIDIQGTGDIKMGAGVPQIIKYEVVYKILQGLIAPGKLDCSIDLVAAKKIFHVAVQTVTTPCYWF